MKHFKLLSIQAAPPSSPSPPPFSSSILNLIAHGVSFRGRLSPFEATKLCSCAGSAKNDTCEIWPEVARGGKFSRDRSRLYRGRFFAIWIFWHCPTLCPTFSPTSLGKSTFDLGKRMDRVRLSLWKACHKPDSSRQNEHSRSNAVFRSFV